MDIQTLAALKDLIAARERAVILESIKWKGEENIYQFESGRHVGMYEVRKLIQELIEKEDEARAAAAA